MELNLKKVSTKMLAILVVLVFIVLVRFDVIGIYQHKILRGQDYSVIRYLKINILSGSKWFCVSDAADAVFWCEKVIEFKED